MHTHCCGAWLCLQESHCSAVQALAFNLCDAGCRNLFATVGKDQVTTVDAIIECGWVFVYYKDASCSECLHTVMFAPCKHPSSMRFAGNPSAVLISFPAGAYAVSLPFTAPPMHRCCTGMPAGAIAVSCRTAVSYCASCRQQSMMTSTCQITLLWWQACLCQTA